MRHKSAIIFLTVFMTGACAIGLAACGGAEESGDSSGGGLQPSGGMQFNFRLNHDGTSYTVFSAAEVDKKSVTEIVVPAEYEGLPVTGIAQEAFSSFTYVTSVMLPETIETIGDRAFANCHSLLSIVFPDAMESLGAHAFAGCDSLISVTLGESFSLPPAEVFGDCEKLVEIYNRSDVELTIGDEDNGMVAYYAKNVYTDPAESKLKEEGDFIFYDDGEERCLMAYTGDGAEVTLPEGTYEIYTGALRYRNRVTSVTIPDGTVTSVGDEAFAYCDALGSISFGKGITSLGSDVAEDSPVTRIGIEDLAAWCALEKEGRLSMATEYGPVELYQGGKAVYDLVIPDGVEEIRAYSFNGFTGIRTLTLADSVARIRDHAFGNCYGLIKVTLGSGARDIYSHAFSLCPKLYEIENNSAESSLRLELPALPDGNDDSNGYLTAYARNIYTAGEGESKIRTTDDGYIYYYTLDEDTSPIEGLPGGTCLLAYTGGETQLVLPEKLDGSDYYIADYAFYANKTLQSVSVSSGVFSIGDRAFAYAENLSGLTFAEGGLVWIGDEAFVSAAVTDVSVPEEVFIGNMAFSDCPLETVILGHTLADYIGSSSFGVFDGTKISIYLLDSEADADPDLAEEFSNHYVYYYSETAPAGEGSYWHYAEDGTTPVVWG